MKTKAILCYGVNQAPVVEEIILDPPKDDEVLVKIMATGVCASDAHVITGTIPSPFPVVLGHEGAGIVEAVGKSVTRVQPGDSVALSWAPDCGHCFFCDSGHSHLCESSAPKVLDGGLLDGTSRMKTSSGETIYHYSFLSTWAQHAVVNEASCIKLDDGMDFAPISLIGCAVMTGIGAAMNTAKVTPGSTVLVYGLGGVGLNVIQGARICGAETIIGVDANADKVDIAKTFGMTHFAKPDEVEAMVASLTRGIGVDFSFEVVGNADLLAQAHALTRRRGTIVAVGIDAVGKNVNLPQQNIPREEKILTGSFYGSANCRLDFPKIARLYQKGEVLLDELVTQTLSLDHIAKALADFKEGKAIRTVLLPHE